MTYPPPFMDLSTLSAHICAAERTIENWVSMGMFPKPRLQGGKRLWRWSDVERHLAGDSDVMHTAYSDKAREIADATKRALGDRT